MRRRLDNIIEECEHKIEIPDVINLHTQTYILDSLYRPECYECDGRDVNCEYYEVKKP